MTTADQITAYFSTQPDAKRADLEALHKLILGLLPNGRLWFLDGKDETGKMVSNPNAGYGLQILKYAGGTTKEFYQIGFSANTSGISVYIMGLKDKEFLAKTYGKDIGKATVTGYCIKFKALKDIDQTVLKAAIKHGIAETAV
jgi:hypothetical protein